MDDSQPVPQGHADPLPRARRSIVARAQAFLPSGGSLPAEEFEARHAVLLRLLWVLAVALPVYSALRGGFTLAHTLSHGLPLVACALLASRTTLKARHRAVACSLGLLTAVALGIHISGGLIEAHFAFFVIVVVLTLYEDWWPFLLAVVYTLLHHGVVGTLDPGAVYDHPDAALHPWKWAVIHAAFVAAAGAGGLITWRLNESVRARMRGLVEQVPAVTYVLDCSGPPGAEQWAYLSPRSVETLGLAAVSDPQPLGFVLDHVHDDDRDAVLARLVQIRASEEPTPIDFRFVRSDGEQVWLRDHGAVVSVEARRHRVQGLLFDITSLKADEAAHNRMELELRLAQKLESVGQLAAGVAHEINTPIQFVSDTFQFLEGAFEDLSTLVTEVHAAVGEGLPAEELTRRMDAAEQRADLDYLQERVPAALVRARDGIQRVGTIVQAMREFAHPPQTTMAAGDLNQALRNTLVVAANEYKYVADIETDFDDLPPILCNEGELGQVFLNLLVNAAHAVSETIGDSDARGTIRLCTRFEDDHVLVSISDTGCGIPAAVAGRVFDPFFTTKDVGKGTGQGLAIARTLIVERHSGALTFETEVGAGTTFHVRLPTGKAAQAPLPVIAS